MANSQNNTKEYSRDATIDTAPGAAGFWCEPVSPRKLKKDKIQVSVRETGASSAFSATVTLQFIMLGDTEWTDYETYTDVTRKIIEDRGQVQWRVGVKNGDYTSGELTVGIDW